jgi:hypothetical protein
LKYNENIRYLTYAIEIIFYLIYNNIILREVKKSGITEKVFPEGGANGFV